MKATLALLTNVITLVATVTTADECHNVCADVKKVVSFKSGCSPFRNSLPRPKVARYCQEGFKASLDTNCYDACVNGGRLQSFLTERRLDEVCQHALKEVPRPLCHDACVRGYRAGVEDMSTTLVKRIAEVAPNVLSSMRKDLAAPQAAQHAHGVAVADFAFSKEPVKATLTDVVTTLAEKVEAKSGGANMLDNEGGIEGAEKRVHEDEEQQQLHPVDKNAEEPSLSAGETNRPEDKITDVSDATSRVYVNEETNEQKDEEEAYIDIGIEENGLVLSLPITVDNVHKELEIFDGDEPIEVVLAFCEENMPEEGAACADQLLRVVQDKFANYRHPDLNIE